jgi:superfamily II DNA or RNA helicase
MSRDDCSVPGDDLVEYARQLCAKRLSAYEMARHDVEEHANIEQSVLAGGYAYRQVAEVIQNAADAVAETAGASGVARIEIVTDRHGLWAANTGAPVDQAGVRALLNAHSSNKRATQIGRFGLGFKSLLKLGGRIDVLSRTVCLHFSPEESRKQIREHLSLDAEAPAPGMRLAEPGPWEQGLLSLEGAKRFDWASTIVFAAMESSEARLEIFREIREFPEEFLLFLPCDVELVLVVGDTRRRLRRRTEDDSCVVIEDLADRKKAPQRWRIFETVVSISDKAAKEDATSVHYRESVPVIWACPIGTARDGGRFKERRTGLFYAFFPTTTDSRTLGIINAPWKLNHDRTALVTGAWNTALMVEAAHLIASRITEMATFDDPGAVLDAFPRELVGSSDPAAPLVGTLWKLLENAPVIPDCDGEFRKGAELGRAPADASRMIADWTQLAPPEACESHVHPTCVSTPARAGRLNTLAGRIEAEAGMKALARTPAEEWLEMTATTDPDAAVDVLRLCDSFAGQAQSIWWDSHRASLRVILAADRTVESAGNLVIGDNPQPPLRAVHPMLTANSEIRKILLERFHVRDGARVTVTDVADAAIARAEQSGDWEPVWILLRKMPLEKAIGVLRRRAIMVRTLSGWALPGRVFRKGELVTESLVSSVEDGNRADAASLIVDSAWHAADAVLLDEMEIEPNPDPSWVSTDVPLTPANASEKWLQNWSAHWVERLYVHLGCRVDKGQLGPGTFAMPYGWQWLPLAGSTHRQHITHWLMESVEVADEEEFAAVEFHHTSRYAYASEAYPHPVWSVLCDFGELAQKDAILPFSALLIEEMTERAGLLPSLQSWAGALSSLEAAGNGWHNKIDGAKAWKSWLHYASREDCEATVITGFYEMAAADGIVPDEVCSEAGSVPLSEIYVTVSHRDAELANDAGLPTVAMSNAATALWTERGALDLSQYRTVEWDEGEPEVIRLVEFEPTFTEILTGSGRADACVSLVGSLRQNIGGKSLPLPWLLHDGIVMVDETQFRSRGWTEQIALLVEAAQASGWIEVEEPLALVLESGPAARRRLVAAEPDLPARLIRAIGDASVLLALFEQQIHIRLKRDMRRTAEVALTMFGPSLLAVDLIRKAMESEGLAPPKSWSGSASANFVASIGFPPEFAVAPQRKREAELSVMGPLPINPLHDFQEDVVASLDNLLTDTSKKRRRAVISLPTGAGKTRVAAELAVTRILNTSAANRVVLWIAQSDELCEQAVQCFRQLWINMGTEEESLRIVRFWGSQSNPKAPEHDEPVVVVATIQTLDSRMGQPGTEWMRNPALVVIDECHHALTTSYTSIFRWIKPSGDTDREPPVIGLSATPFRGRNVEETAALARRFDGRLYPKDQAHLFEDLQDRGVLARFGYTKLAIQERLELTADEEASFIRYKTLPTGAMERLGRMSDRNDKIVDAIEEAEENSALVFATSVSHARRLAARLNLLGIKAAAVTGETDRNSRRWFIDAFRRGDIRVLCNHSALTTGFDAPATDLIVIARPVFSPSLYMQMVGRGLRGPVNGGKEKCRILTVQDNLDQYTDMLAHHYFEQHYVDG